MILPTIIQAIHKLPKSRRIYLLLFLFTLTSFDILAAEKRTPAYEDEDVYIRLFSRSPNQMAAFYEGREFPKNAINRIIKVCNVTTIIHNKTSDFLWIDLDKWKFKKNGKMIPRIDREYWKKQWKEIKLSAAHQATFGWTLMPEVRDLHPDEGVGGSTNVPWQTEPFDITFNFPVGKNQSKKMKSVTIKRFQCKENKEDE